MLGAGVLGKHAGQPAVISLVENRAERAGQFEPSVQVKFVGLRRVRVFDLRAEALSQFVEDAFQRRKNIHTDIPPGNVRQPRSPSP